MSSGQQTGLGQQAGGFPAFVAGLMNTAPGSIDRRFPKWWSDGEGGIDWSAPVGTPVVALADGVVKGAGYFCVSSGNFAMTSDSGACGHGVITTRVTNADGTQTDLYYQHILLAPGVQLCFKSSDCTQTVKKGQVIGYISDFGMLEMGVNIGNIKGTPPYPNGWGSIWGTDPAPGPHVDPEPYLRALISGQNTTGLIPGAGFASGAGSATGGFPDISAITNVFTKLGPWLSNPARILKLVVGVLLIGLSVYMLIDPEVASKVGNFVKENPEVLA